MPVLKTQNVGKILHELKHKGKKRPHKQRVAIALDVARKAGANIPTRKKAETHNEHLARRMTS